MASNRPASSGGARPAAASSAPPASVELTRLLNLLRVKDKELEQVNAEVTTLRSLNAVKDRELQKQLAEASLQKERAVALDGALASANKDLAAHKADKKKLESQTQDLTRKAQKLNEKWLAAANKVPGGAEVIASLQADVKTAKAEADANADHCKALEGIIRAKDKELARLQKRADEADMLAKRCGELENKLGESGRLLENANKEVRLLQSVGRNTDGEIVKQDKELEGVRGALRQAQEALATAHSGLKAYQTRCGELEQELSVLKEELARTGAVAARAAVSEVKGLKGEGTVPLSQHVEEMRYMGGEVCRLKERIALLERDLSVAHELKERFRRASVSSMVPLPASPDATPASPPPPFTSTVRGSPQWTPNRRISASDGATPVQDATGRGRASPMCASAPSRGSPSPITGDVTAAGGSPSKPVSRLPSRPASAAHSRIPAAHTSSVTSASVTASMLAGASSILASVTPTKKAVGTGKAAVADTGGVSTTGGTCRVQRLPDKAAVQCPSTVSEKLQAAAAAGADSAKDVEGIVLAAADVDMAVINTAAAGEVQLQDGGCSVDVAAPQDRDGDVALMVLQRAQAQMAEAEAAAETEAFT